MIEMTLDLKGMVRKGGRKGIRLRGPLVTLLAVAAGVVWGVSELSSQDLEPDDRQFLFGLALTAGSASRLAPAFCLPRARTPERRAMLGAEARGVVAQARVRLEFRAGVHRMREASYVVVCPLAPPHPHGPWREEEHPRGSGLDVTTTDLRIGWELVESGGVVASAGIGRIWSHHRTYLASGLGVRRGERTRLALDVEGMTFQHTHTEVTRRMESDRIEEIGRREVGEWHTSLGVRIAFEVPVGGGRVQR